eukprot:jgi/Mesen1/10806/ME000092S10290
MDEKKIWRMDGPLWRMLCSYWQMDSPANIVTAARELGGGVISEASQIHLLSTCIQNKRCQLYPPDRLYTARVLKGVILAAESDGEEVMEDLYSLYVAYSTAPPEGRVGDGCAAALPGWCYRTYAYTLPAPRSQRSGSAQQVAASQEGAHSADPSSYPLGSGPLANSGRAGMESEAETGAEAKSAAELAVPGGKGGGRRGGRGGGEVGGSEGGTTGGAAAAAAARGERGVTGGTDGTAAAAAAERDGETGATNSASAAAGGGNMGVTGGASVVAGAVVGAPGGGGGRLVTLRVSMNMLQGSTGCSVWPAGIYLAEFLMSFPRVVAGRRCLELGSGSGLVGACLARLCPKKVVLTDGNLEALHNLSHNLTINGARIALAPPEDQQVAAREEHGTAWQAAAPSRETSDALSGPPVGESADVDAPEVSCTQLRWEDAEREELEAHEADLILGADLVYDPRVVPMLVKVLALLLQRTPKVGEAEEKSVGTRLNDGDDRLRDSHQGGPEASGAPSRAEAEEVTVANAHRGVGCDAMLEGSVADGKVLSNSHLECERGIERGCSCGTVCGDDGGEGCGGFDGGADLICSYNGLTSACVDNLSKSTSFKCKPFALIATALRNEATLELFLRSAMEAGLRYFDVSSIMQPDECFYRQAGASRERIFLHLMWNAGEAV